MYDIIPLIIILISLAVIIVIVVRKFSVLATLDVANIPAEKEAKFKERIIGTRLKRNVIKWWSKAFRLIGPVLATVVKFFSWLQAKLLQLRSDYQDRPIKADEIKPKIDQLFNEAEDCKKQEDLTAAEKKYIEIIGVDSRNIQAFKELGLLYFEQKNYEEAKQTFEHILKLKQDDEDAYSNLALVARERGDLREAKEDYLKSLNVNKQNAQTYFNLALVYQAMNNNKKAVSSLKEALKIEPNNPRYLDTMLEISKIIKDKALAWDAYKKLAEVNPDNKKLDAFKRKINKF